MSNRRVQGEGTDFVAVQGFAADALGCSPDRIAAVSRFEDGNRHAVYKVSYLDSEDSTEHVVVRVSLRDDPTSRAAATWEAGVLEIVGGVAGPRLHRFRSTSPWFEAPAMCMAFVPGESQELSSATPDEMERLGSLVAWVHARPVDNLADGGAGAADVASYGDERMRSILGTMLWVRDPVPATVQERLQGAAISLESAWESWRDADSFSTGDALALLHGDIGPGNVLWGPDPVLIDWEYSRLGDPADEIAYLFDQNGLVSDQREAFWRGYREAVSDDLLSHAVDRVRWWEPLTLLGSSLWWVERWVRRTEADAAGAVDPEVHREAAYYLDHVLRRLDRLEALLL